MMYVSTVARVLLGLLFIVVGLNGFLLFLPMPPPGSIPAEAMQFSALMFKTHYIYVTMGVQVAAGLLLLLNRYVTLALVALAAVLVNVLTFHATMWPQALLPMPVVALVLWFLACWPLRHRFALLFAASSTEEQRVGSSLRATAQR